MKITLATPLYPPEISDAASYVKELAKILSSKHEIVVLTYGYMPEKVKGVRIYTINKNNPLPIRLFLYFLALWKTSKGADVIYAQNGASVELPITIISMLRKVPVVLSFSDSEAHLRTSQKGIMKLIENLAMKKSVSAVKSFPMRRPIISPFKPRDKNEWYQYETSWVEHVNYLEKLFKNGRKI